MILNYFIQPVFMIVVVFFLYRIAKHLGSIDKNNKLQSDNIEKKSTDNEIQVNSEGNE
jgi:hypothetical protein